MPTYLQTLAEIHKAQEQSATLRLQASERTRDQLHRVAESQQLFEHACWDSADPLQPGNAIPAGLGSAPNDLYHPMAIGRHNAYPGSRRHGAQPPLYWTEQHHWMMVDAARTLDAFCPTATNILDVLEQFAIFTGFQYKIVEKKGPNDGTQGANSTPGPEDETQSATPATPQVSPIVGQAQELLDRWQRDVDWHSWEREIFRRSRRDGEAFLVMELDEETGMLGLRSVEPEQIRDPNTSTGAINGRLGISGKGADWKFGVLTTKEDTSKPIKYNVVSQYNDTHRQHVIYDADEVFHLKINVDRNSKRGWSDFGPVVNDIPGTKKLLRNLREGANVQAQIAWIVEQASGMEGLPPAMGDGAATSRTGRNVSPRMMDGPEIVGVSSGIQYHEAPIGQSETLILVLQAALRNIGARWQMPEGLVSGDASNANLASALVAEAPFVRAMEARQWLYRNAYKRLMECVLERAAVDGLLPEGENLLDKIEVSIEMPPVVPRKAKEETERNAILSDHGILGNSSWSAREDLDREEEVADMEADPIQPPSIMLGLPEGEAEDDTAQEGSQSGEGERVS